MLRLLISRLEMLHTESQNTSNGILNALCAVLPFKSKRAAIPDAETATKGIPFELKK